MNTRHQTDAAETAAEETAGRRGLLKFAAAAAAGFGVAALGHDSPSAAANNDFVKVGQNHTGTLPTAFIGSALTSLQGGNSISVGGGHTAGGIGVQGVSAGGAAPVGVQGLADAPGGLGVDGSGDTYGVLGRSNAGVGVRGTSSTSAGIDAVSNSYIDLRCYGTGRLWLSGHRGSGSPTSGQYFEGEVIHALDGSFWGCVETGSPGVWRKIASRDSAGSFHPMTPARMYDSRLDMSPMANGVIAPSQTRVITCADKRNTSTGVVEVPNAVPAGATAIAYNITLAQTVGRGYLCVNLGVDSTVNASVINWFANGQTIANAAVVGVDSSRRITLVCGGIGGAQTHVIIDVNGYYL